MLIIFAVIATSSCNHDNLYLSFVDPRTSASASSFCSTYIQSTLTTTITTIPNPAAKRHAKEKRGLAGTTYPPVRLSSVCFCILSAQPSPTISTVTIPTAENVCTNPATIVKNGDFEAGLDSWIVSNITPPLPEYAQYLAYGVKAPGYKSANAFTVVDQVASSYVEVDLDQTLTLCAGKTYNVDAQFYMTDSHDTPQQTYVEAFVDDNLIASSSFADAVGPPIVWKGLSGSFTAASASPTLTFKFVATDYLGVTWGLDKVSVAPA